LKTVLHGFWSLHSSEVEEAKELWRIRESYDKGQAKIEELKAAQDKLTTHFLKLQDDLGIDILSDGGFRWDSSLDIARRLKGCLGFKNLQRIGVTNHFHRAPIVEAMPVWQEPILLLDFIYANAATLKPIMVHLPGPYTLARQSLNPNEESGFNKELVLAYAEAINLEIKSLLEANASYVKVDDSEILGYPDDRELIKEAFQILTAKLDFSRIYLHTTGFSVNNFPNYFDLPFGGFFLDFASSLAVREENLAAVKNLPQSCCLGVGLVNAARSYLPPTVKLLEFLRALNKKVPLEKLFLCPNADLDFLPWKIAVEKVKQLVDVARVVNWVKEAK